MSKAISLLIRKVSSSLMALGSRKLKDVARVVWFKKYVENLYKFGGKLRNKLSTMRKTKKFTAPDAGDGSTSVTLDRK